MKHATPVTTALGSVVLRNADGDDIPAVARLWHDGWRDGHIGHVSAELLVHRTASEFERRSRTRIPQTTVAITQPADAIAGFVVVAGCEVEQLYVDATWRGSGVASHLLAAAEAQIREAGASVAWLAVVAGNRRARRFYERCGWADRGAFDNLAEISDGTTLRVPCRRYEKPLDPAPE